MWLIHELSNRSRPMSNEGLISYLTLKSEWFSIIMRDGDGRKWTCRPHCAMPSWISRWAILKEFFPTIIHINCSLVFYRLSERCMYRSPNWFSKYGFHLCAFPERECRRVLWFNGSPIRMTAATEKTFWPTLMPKGLTLQVSISLRL